MRSLKIPKFLGSILVSIAIYPIVFLGIWGLMVLGGLASDWQMPTDTMPLIYGLVYAVLTVALIDLLGVACVVLGLVSIANLIEYAQIVVPGRTASAVDFMAGLAGIVVAALLVWMARSLMQRFDNQETDDAVASSKEANA